MSNRRAVLTLAVLCLFVATRAARSQASAAENSPAVTPPAATSSAVALPEGVKAVWDIDKAHRETTATRQRISINGLWQWQPTSSTSDAVPTANWGYFKVPGSWPGIGDYMQKDSQTLYAHPSWKNEALGKVAAAWYARTIRVPKEWTGRRITLALEYLNSSAAVYVDGKAAGEIQFPAGELDLTAVCVPGREQVLALRVVAKPLHEVMLMFNDTNAAKRARTQVARRGLSGDVWLEATPPAVRLGEVKVDTSLRKGQITLATAITNPVPKARYRLRAAISDRGRPVKEFTSEAFAAEDLKEGRAALTEKWKPEKLWDLHTPQNTYELAVSLVDDAGKLLDAARPVRFGFREFWIDGRDFYLNGTRIFLSALPLDNAQIGAAAATYDAAVESLRRLKDIGINFVYTHNYGCEPGSHLSFEEILRAADDVGMLVSLSQPHFSQYDWQSPNAAVSNGYAHHARFYVRVAGSHPSVVFYSMSHNATGYADDMNPDMIDGIQSRRDKWADTNLKRALQAEAIVARLDPGRIVYHHSSGNLSSMHTSNFYTNMAPIQELDDWFEHWSTAGVKPMFTCEYMVPCTWDWTMYRGWYKGVRNFGSAVAPWEFCIAEWSSQFLGDQAYQISEEEKKNLRWESEQFRAGRLWHRWDYPHQVGSEVFQNQHTIIGKYLASNWRAFRTWGLAANSPWEHSFFWSLRDGADTRRKALKVDWENLQRPGFSPDYIDRPYERMDLAYERSDWVPTADGQAILRNNMPLLAYVGGKADAFTSKDHNFTPGETVEKQLIVINNSRQTVTADCVWSLGLPQPLQGARKITLPTGQQERVAMSLPLPAALAPGKYELAATVRFSDGQTQKDSFTLHVMPRPAAPRATARIALFDPKGQSAALLAALGVQTQPVEAVADLSGYDVLVIGKGALTLEGPAPDVRRVRDGLKVVVFEQTSEVLEKRLGFRVAEYGLRQVFHRVSDHPLVAGLDGEALRDWRGAATLLPPRLNYTTSRTYGGPAVEWCGLEVPRVWRCGNRGNVASVLIEKPARGDFLPILDGGYSLQYSPLMEYREGSGLVLFCQVDVTGRTEQDPAAETLLGNLMQYVCAWKPAPRRSALYVGNPAGKRHLAFSGIAARDYQGGSLSGDQVLVVGTDAGPKLAAHAQAIHAFLKSGGHLLALGLDQPEANAFLPFEVSMKKAEHIAAFFPPAGKDSLLAGVGPADVHNRAPRSLPLVSAGATVIGNGVLAKAQTANVVFCQLPPYTVSRAEGALPSFAVSGDDACDGKQSALVITGSVNGQGVQLGQLIKRDRLSTGKTYTLAAFVKALDGPVAARLDIEPPLEPRQRGTRDRQARPQENPQRLPENQWTELHLTFKIDAAPEQDWLVHLRCAEEGARLRADRFRLYEGEYVAAKAPGDRIQALLDKPAVAPGAQGAASDASNLLVNPSFESGTSGWRFSYHQQHNLRRTYRRTAFQLARLLANMGVSAPTPLLARFSVPVKADPAEKRWLGALYLDEPEDWDDPYRFFRW